MSREYVVRIPGHPPGGNDLHRMHHWQVRKMRETWKPLASGLALHVLLDADPAKRGLPLEKARLGATWRFRIRRNRDLDNLIAGLKPLIDGLVDAGMIRDDSSACLQEIGPLRVEVGANADETVLTVVEILDDAQIGLPL